MKKILLVAGALLLLGVVAVAGAGVYLASRLNTPEFEKAILDQAKATLGSDLMVQEMEISILSGVKLEGIAVRNPAPFRGDLLTADAFVLRYRLLPLLAGRVEVERLLLEKPTLWVAMDAQGSFNYEKLGGSAAKGAATKPGSQSSTPSVPLRIVMKSLGVERGSIVMNDHTRARLLSVEDVEFGSAFEVENGAAQGKGDVAIGKANVADVLFVSGVKAPLVMSKERVTLAPIRGELAGGQVSGDLKLDLKGGFGYTTELVVKGARVKTLLEQAKSAAVVSGTLSGKAHFEGKGGLATMRGHGSADVTDCRAEQSRVLALLSSVLQVPELANPDFEACRVEFSQTGSRFATPVLQLTGDAVRLKGRGSVNLDTSGLDYEMTLGLAQKLFAKITRPELRAGFKQASDGFATIDFRVFGTTLEPKTDLLSRVGRAAAAGVAKEQVNKLLKRKIF